MKLETIEIRNYRSLFHDYEDGQSFRIDLSDGMNTLIGANNVGKSNVFRALALALDEDFNFDRSSDMPSAWAWSKPTITLSFRVPSRGRSSREATLLKYLDEYERAVNKDKTTYANEGLVKLRVTIEGGADSAGTRRQVFVVRGVGSRNLADDHPLALKALRQFRSCFHFVLINSGQSLQGLMEGKFRDILRNVLRENLKPAYEAAEQSRANYSADLQDGLMASLCERVDAELRELFPEITSVLLTPDVQSLDETLSNLRIDVVDAASTDLADKGAGVRGGLIVAILRHFADVGRRSMLFAVEEPESFLHPAAQEQLREDLEALAVRSDVSLIVTTHSPYIVSKRPDAKVFSLTKAHNGGTRLADQASGDEPHAKILGGLFRDRMFGEWIDRSRHIPPDARLVLVVEGATDQAFAELALVRAGRAELLDGIHFVLAGMGQAEGAGGAALAAAQALLMRAVTTVPVAALFDNDEPGKEAANTLRKIRQHTGDWQEKRQLFSYRHVFKGPKDFAYEAEDLWPDRLLEAFLQVDGNDRFDGGKWPRPKPEGGFQYHVQAAGKRELVEYLERTVTATDCSEWVSLYELIRGGSGLAVESPDRAGSD